MESFKPVTTEPEIPAGSNLSSLIYDSNGLCLILISPDDIRLKVCYKHELAHRVTDEGDRLRSMNYLNGKAETPMGVIEDSTWSEWLSEESLGIRESSSLTHWCIITPNEIIDILSETKPTVTRLLDP